MKSAKPKYSVVIPVLNGGGTLRETLPRLLDSPRQDFEVVISENHSTDGTAVFLASIHDERVKVVSPSKRLPWGENLNFGYLHAGGEWLSHMGDDDLVFPNRFEILDEIIDTCAPDLVVTRPVRYYWPDFGDGDLANSIDPFQFTGEVQTISDQRALIEKAMSIMMPGGAMLLFKRGILEKIKQRAGFYSSAQHGEAFMYRAALLLSQTASFADYPTYVLGRSPKSIAVQHLGSKKDYKEKGETDISKSDPLPFTLQPWNYKGYYTWSLDALLLTDKLFPEAQLARKITWPEWIDNVWGEMNFLAKNGQIPADVSPFLDGLNRLDRSTAKTWLVKNRLRMSRDTPFFKEARVAFSELLPIHLRLFSRIFNLASRAKRSIKSIPGPSRHNGIGLRRFSNAGDGICDVPSTVMSAIPGRLIMLG